MNDIKVSVVGEIGHCLGVAIFCIPNIFCKFFFAFCMCFLQQCIWSKQHRISLFPRSTLPLLVQGISQNKCQLPEWKIGFQELTDPLYGLKWPCASFQKNVFFSNSKTQIKGQIIATWCRVVLFEFHLKFWNTAIIGIPDRGLYKVDRLLTAQQKGTTARWYSNKVPNSIIIIDW